MKRILISTAAALICLAGAAAGKGIYPQIGNIPARTQTSLDGRWKIIVDRYGYSDFFADKHFYDDETQLIQYDFNAASELSVPGDWNTQRPEFLLYEGTIWYRRTFEAHPAEGKRLFLHFGAVNHAAEVALNGKVIGRHEGGYTPFEFEISSRVLEGENSLVVKVTSTLDDSTIPTNRTDWWNYGGITRSVCLVETPSTFIRDYGIELKRGSLEGRKPRPALCGWVQLDGPAKTPVQVAIPELGFSVSVTPDENGYAAFEARLPKPKLLQAWTPSHPKLYSLTVSSGEDSVSDKVGLRTIEVSGYDILLNGKSIFLKGINIHEEAVGKGAGRAFSKEQDIELLSLAKDLGCNFVRLAHYPHNEYMTRMADEMGLLVWSEIPVYWGIDFASEEAYSNAAAQLESNIARDHNRASVIIWSVANETNAAWSGGGNPARVQFLGRLVDLAHKKDPSRLVSSASTIVWKEHTDSFTINEPLIEKLDLVGMNEYFGWYDWTAREVPNANWDVDFGKPVIVSETGGGCLAGNHGSPDARFTEENLVLIYEGQIEMVSRIPQLRGFAPWLLKDFRSHQRLLDGRQDMYNRKGLVSDEGVRKDAFKVLQQWYNSF